jgi:hypothetical protein
MCARPMVLRKASELWECDSAMTGFADVSCSKEALQASRQQSLAYSVIALGSTTDVAPASRRPLDVHIHDDGVTQ